MKEPEYCYTLGDQFELSLSDALVDYFDYCSERELLTIARTGKVEVERGVVRQPKPSDYFGKWGVEDILENMNCRATDDAGEHAEDFAMNVPAEAKAELQALIEAWADKNLSCDFYRVDSIEKIVVDCTTELEDYVS